MASNNSSVLFALVAFGILILIPGTGQASTLNDGDCQGYSNQDVVLGGAEVCSLQNSDIPSTDARSFASGMSLDEYYGYLSARTQIRAIQNDRNRSNFLSRMFASIMDIHHDYSAAFGVVVGLLNADGSETPILTIPLAAYSMHDGAVVQADAAHPPPQFNIVNGRLGPYFSMRNGKKLRIHFKVAVSNSSTADPSKLIAALQIAANVTGYGVLVAPAITSGIHTVTSAASSAATDVLTEETIAYLTPGPDANNDVELKLIAPHPDSNALKSGNVSIALTLHHKVSLLSNDDAAAIRIPSKPTIGSALHIGVSSTQDIQDVIDTIGVPVTGITQKPTEGAISTKDAIGKTCTTLEKAFRNPHYIELSDYDIEKLKYDYLTVALDGDVPSKDSVPSSCVSTSGGPSWDDYHLYLADSDAPSISEADAQDVVSKLFRAMNSSSSDTRSTTLSVLTDSDFTLISENNLLPSSESARFQRCKPNKGCEADVSTLAMLHFCRVGPAFKNGRPDFFGNTPDLPTDIPNAPTNAFSFHVLIEGQKQLYTARALMGNHEELEKLYIEPVNEKDGEIWYGHDPDPTTKQPRWTEADNGFLSANERASLASNGAKCQ